MEINGQKEKIQEASTDKFNHIYPVKCSNRIPNPDKPEIPNIK